jgi:hypothetical protein
MNPSDPTVMVFTVVRTGLTTGFQCSSCDRDATHLVLDRTTSDLPTDYYDSFCLFCVERMLLDDRYPRGIKIRKLKVIHESQD